MAGEATSSRRKRQRLVEEEEEEGENSGGDVVARSGTLLDLELLDCPVCFDSLTKPIFRCDSGHIACQSCCKKQRYKCSACYLPIGNYRCRILETVVEAVIVPCPNAKYGCSEKFYYGKELVHEKECIFTPCYCPAPDCNYRGMYKDLYSHYDANHKSWCGYDHFGSGHETDAWLPFSEKILVLQEYQDGPLVVIQGFEKPDGVSFTVNCIAPSAHGVGEFAFVLSDSYGGEHWTRGSDKMNKIQKVSFQAPEKCFITVPMSNLKMKIRITRRNEEERR
ncbi:hypothetical protein CARUB_v10022345mg [Capsella rubella]|uniref:RING-type E3 ubiquitin transferase n=1 Tax=Capsella rubella TaxID=81985 RepID=R0I9H2_9BRAS|nr:hypothetical protein CARUB_v10022345mg [Capsella rubella]